MLNDDFEKDKIKGKNQVWRKLRIPSRLKQIFAFLISLALPILLVLLPLFFKKNETVSNTGTQQVIGEKAEANSVFIQGDNNSVYFERHNDENNPSELKKEDENCYTDWIPFTIEFWEGLNTGFEQVNGVFTLPSLDKRTDSVAFYNKPCKGPLKVELEFISYVEQLINLNVYYGNWFRWEVGGRDLRSVKLYKNLEGCKAFKYAVLQDTIFEYLPEDMRFMPGKPIIVSMPIFLTDKGKLRTELHLEFTSESGAKVFINDRFFYEFDVDWKCDENTVLDINEDSQRLGVGLMPSYVKDEELPSVRLEKFKVQKFEAEK